MYVSLITNEMPNYYKYQYMSIKCRIIDNKLTNTALELGSQRESIC